MLHAFRLALLPCRLRPVRRAAGQGVLLWRLLALWLGLLAVFAGLAMPVAMLAADVRAGVLGGICSTGQTVAGKGTAAASAAVFTGGATPDLRSNPASGAALEMPCDTCAFLAWHGLAPPPGAAPPPGLIAWFGRAGNAGDLQLPRTEHGLPHSRAPPAPLLLQQVMA